MNTTALRACASGVWIEPTELLEPAPAEGYAIEPPRRRLGRPRKSPDTPQSSSGPASDSLPIA